MLICLGDLFGGLRGSMLFPSERASAVTTHSAQVSVYLLEAWITSTERRIDEKL